MDKFPHVQQRLSVDSLAEVLGDRVSWGSELDELGAVVDLVSEPVRRLVNIHRSDEFQVPTKCHVLLAKVERSLITTLAHFECREELREVVLDARQVHLVENEKERPCGALRLSSLLPLGGGGADKQAELRVVVRSVDRVEIPK